MLAYCLKGFIRGLEGVTVLEPVADILAQVLAGPAPFTPIEGVTVFGRLLREVKGKGGFHRLKGFPRGGTDRATAAKGFHIHLLAATAAAPAWV